MKIIAYISAIIIFSLSVYPCSDGFHCDEDQEVSAHNHSEDEDDNCSPFCLCACCGSTYMETAFKAIEPTTDQVIFAFNFHYSAHYSFSYQSTIWQPPTFC